MTILVTSTDEKLTTRDLVKESLDIDDSNNDNFIDNLIKRAGRRIQSHLNRTITIQKYQLILPSYGSVNLLLSEYPIRDVFRVFDGSDTGTASELTSTDYRINKETGQLNRDKGWAWSRQVENRQAGPADIIVPGGEWKRWLVEFSAGYVLAGGLATDSPLWSTEGGSTSTGKTLPDDLEDACIDLVRTSYLSRQRDPRIESEKVGDVTIRYSKENSNGLPGSVSSILENYRSIL